MLDLQAPTVVLEEHRDRAPVRMRRHPRHRVARELLRLDRRVVQEPQLVVLAAVESQQIIRVIQPYAYSYGSQELLCGVIAGPVEARRELPEPWEHLLGQPLVRLLGEGLAADLVGLFAVLHLAELGILVV